MAGRAVLFDLDNTLYCRDGALEAFVRRQYDERDFAAYGFEFDDWKARFIELDAKGKVWKDAVYRTLQEEFALRHTVAELLIDYERGFSRHVEIVPDVEATFRALKDRGWKIGIVTNGRTAFQTRTLDALGIEPYIDAFLVSEAVGMRKPEAGIFHEALGRVGADVDRSWFIGDDPTADLEGATRAGLWALHFDATGNGRGRHSVPSLASMADLLDFVEP